MLIEIILPKNKYLQNHYIINAGLLKKIIDV